MGEWPVRLIPANVSPTTGLSRTLDQRPWSSGTIGKQTLEKKAATHRRAYLLALPGRLSGDGRHSHSIVAGGLPLMSYTTRLIPRTSLMMRLLTLPSRLWGSSAQWAVMKSWVCTARRATTYS